MAISIYICVQGKSIDHPVSTSKGLKLNSCHLHLIIMINQLKLSLGCVKPQQKNSLFLTFHSRQLMSHQQSMLQGKILPTLSLHKAILLEPQNKYITIQEGCKKCKISYKWHLDKREKYKRERLCRLLNIYPADTTQGVCAILNTFINHIWQKKNKVTKILLAQNFTY